jgi:hypothetical protein
MPSSPVYAVGQTLSTGVTVVSDTAVTMSDGSTVEVMTASDGSQVSIFTPGANTPVANMLTIQANLLARLAAIEAWVAANPAGAVLTAAQTLALVRIVAGLVRLQLQDLSTTGAG